MMWLEALYKSRGGSLCCAVAALAGAMMASGGAAAETLADVRARGYVLCGVSEDAVGFSRVDTAGNWSGLDIDFCAALAAGTLGNKSAVKFRPLSTAASFRALMDGEIDVLASASGWTLSRDTELGVRFVGTLFHDGQGFLVRRDSEITSVLELSGASVCLLAGTNAEQGLADYFGAKGMRYAAVPHQRWDDVVKAYLSGGCTLMTGDISQLAFERSRFSAPGDHTLLSETIAKSPLGPLVRQGDDQWFSIVRWGVMALIMAEELGLGSANIEGQRGSPSREVRRFIGEDGNLGQGMGLPSDWAYQMVKQVGNYGELFERNLGSKSDLRLERGLDNLWSKGGLHYAAPFR